MEGIASPFRGGLKKPIVGDSTDCTDPSLDIDTHPRIGSSTARCTGRFDKHCVLAGFFYGVFEWRIASEDPLTVPEIGTIDLDDCPM